MSTANNTSPATVEELPPCNHSIVFHHTDDYGRPDVLCEKCGHRPPNWTALKLACDEVRRLQRPKAVKLPALYEHTNPNAGPGGAYYAIDIIKALRAAGVPVEGA